MARLNIARCNSQYYFIVFMYSAIQDFLLLKQLDLLVILFSSLTFWTELKFDNQIKMQVFVPIQ